MNYKLAKQTNGKLRMTNNNLCHSCCPDDTCPCCPTQLSPPCIACPDFCIPAVVRVNLSGITVASDCQYWLRGIGVPFPGGGAWCNEIWAGFRKFDFEGSAVNGSYDVPIGLTGQGTYGRYCGGYLDVPFDGRLENFTSEGMGDPCDGGCDNFYSTEAIYTKLRIGVGGVYVRKTSPSFPHPEVPPEFGIFTVSVSIITASGSGTGLFSGVSEQFPLYPVENRLCFGGNNEFGEGTTLSNSYDTPYSCVPYGGNPCWFVDFVPAWGGTATIGAVPSAGCVKFPFHIKSFGPLQVLGSYLGAYLDLDDSLLPHSVPLWIAYKFSYEGGEYINELCSYSDGYPFLAMPYTPGIGLVTLEILSMTNASASNIVWDQSADEAPHIIAGVF